MYWFERERKGGTRVGGERERENWFVVSLISAFIGWFLFVPWPRTEPTTLTYQDNDITNSTTRPGPRSPSGSFYYSVVYTLGLWPIWWNKRERRKRVMFLMVRGRDWIEFKASLFHVLFLCGFLTIPLCTHILSLFCYFLTISSLHIQFTCVL